LSSSQFDTRDSFAHPNAQCPVCGKAVFFYQNIHGSKVYFDHLGQPWPKHPCTNNDNEFKGESFCYSAASGYTFELNSHNAKGWTPIARASISEIRHGVLKLEAIDGAKIHIINAEKVKNGNKYVLRDIIPKYMIAPDFIFYRNPLPSAGNAIYEVDFYSVEVGSHLECGVESLKISLACVADIRKGVFGKPVVSQSTQDKQFAHQTCHMP